MRAEIGKRYCQILSGRVHWKFDHTILPEWADGAFQVVEISAPEPDEGDLFDGVNFSKPVPPPPPTPAERETEGRRRMAADPLILAVILWAAQRFGISPAIARDEIAAIYRNIT